MCVFRVGFCRADVSVLDPLLAHSQGFCALISEVSRAVVRIVRCVMVGVKFSVSGRERERERDRGRERKRERESTLLRGSNASVMS